MEEQTSRGGELANDDQINKWNHNHNPKWFPHQNTQNTQASLLRVTDDVFHPKVHCGRGGARASYPIPSMTRIMSGRILGRSSQVAQLGYRQLRMARPEGDIIDSISRERQRPSECRLPAKILDTAPGSCVRGLETRTRRGTGMDRKLAE